MLYFVDTNVFLRLLVKENEKTFQECHAFFSALQEGKISACTSSLVLAEISWVLQSFYKLEKKRALQALESILNLKNLKIEDRVNPREALFIFQSANVKFIDALLASSPKVQRRETVLVSYDKDFDKIKNIIRKEPSQVI